MKKNLFYLLLVSSLYSCSSDEDIDINLANTTWEGCIEYEGSSIPIKI